jgi:1-acyl-sn-glycerol-3-phosphate acyltransferase
MLSSRGRIFDRIKAYILVALVCYVMISHILIMITNHLLITLLFFYISPWIFQKSMRLSESSGSGVLLTLSNWCFPSRYVLSFENEDSYIQFKESMEGSKTCSNDIVISNHQIYTDWLYIWGLFSWMGKSGNIKITLKKSLQLIPVVGLGMKLCGFIFISRKWNVDQSKFIRRIARLVDYKPFSLLIFPEGKP